MHKSVDLASMRCMLTGSELVGFKTVGIEDEAAMTARRAEPSGSGAAHLITHRVGMTRSGGVKVGSTKPGAVASRASESRNA